MEAIKRVSGPFSNVKGCWLLRCWWCRSVFMSLASKTGNWSAQRFGQTLFPFFFAKLSVNGKFYGHDLML